jgi:TonB family protein
MARMRLDPAGVASGKLPRRKLGAGPGFILSVLLHSLPLLSLVGWRPTPPELQPAVAVQLVIEQPPSTPPPTLAEPKPASDPPRGPIASDDFAPVAATETRPGMSDTASAAGGPEPPVDAHSAAPKPPLPATEPVRQEEPPIAPAPPPTRDTEITIPPPLPKRPPQKQSAALEMPVPMSSGWPLPLHRTDPHPAQRLASLVGPPAVRDEYCVRALNLTLRHLDQLPLSALGGRRGRTVVTIRILGDGTINSVAIAQSSGYPDLDQRVQKMVFAVGQYPPLPPRIPGTSADFTFAMVFPDPRQH